MRPGDEPTRRIGPPVTRRLPPPPQDGPDEVLAGRYRLDGVIGSGGLAEVYRATDLQLGRPVAVKVFRPGTDPGMLDDIRAVAGLRHPGLVAVHDVGTDRDRPYLVMELVDGPTLHQELGRGPFDAAEVTRIGTELAQVLAAVHEQGVVHGALTPSNVLLEQDGRVRLADLGVQRGTAGPPADVYALGLVLLEALTGRPVRRADGPPAVPGGTPSPLREALHAMTVTDPARRPSAREVAGMLAGLAVAPANLGNGRRGALVALGVAGLLAVLVGVVLAIGSAGRDTPVAAAPTTAPARSAPAVAPTTEPGRALPGLPTALPSLPNIPTALPDLPTAIPTIPPDVQEEAKSLWERIREWWSSLF